MRLGHEHTDIQPEMITSRWQERFWLEWKLQPNNTTYHLDLQFDLHGVISEGSIERMLDTLRSQHTILQSRFLDKNRKIVREVDPKMPLQFSRYTANEHKEL